MGRPLRNGSTGFSVSIKPLVKTCPGEAGLFGLNVPDGTNIAVLAHTFWPSHDRSLVDTVMRFLDAVNPGLTVFLGGAVHEEAWKVVTDDDDVVSELIGTAVPPEITQVKKSTDVIEKRWLDLAALGGKFITSFAEASGGHLIYVPSVTNTLPNEVDIMRHVLEQKRRLDKQSDTWDAKHPDEKRERGPDVPSDFAKFLGINKHPQVSVLPFGAALTMNENAIFTVGDFRRRNPGTAAWVEAHNHMLDCTIRSFDGKVSSGWKTTPIHTYPRATRRFWQTHEVGNLFDLTQGLGYLRNYDRRAKGIWFGTVVGGKIFGASVPVIAGTDGRRSIVVDCVAYTEESRVTGTDSAERMKSRRLHIPSSKLVSSKAGQGKPAATSRKSSKKK